MELSMFEISNPLIRTCLYVRMPSIIAILFSNVETEENAIY